LYEEANMKRQKSNLFLVVLVFILVIPLALSCEGTPNSNGSSEWDWRNCPGALLAEDVAIRLEELPSGWVLSLMHGDPYCGCPFNIVEKASVELMFEDEKPWNKPRRSVFTKTSLRWEQQAVIYYFVAPEDSVAINITGADEAYIKVLFTEVGEPSLNCTYGVSMKFRKGLYDVYITSQNMDLQDLCIEEGEEVDAEVAFVTDLATKVASRIP
jgi:hypothetical protein